MNTLYKSLVKVSNLINPNLDISKLSCTQHKHEKINFIDIFTSLPLVYELEFIVVESFQPIIILEQSNITTNHDDYVTYGYLIFDKDISLLSSMELKNIVKLSHAICYFRYSFIDEMYDD